MADKKPKTVGARAIHAKRVNDKEHLVLLMGVKVLVSVEDGSWFAQGLDIDYFAQGNSLTDVQESFQEGLRKTIFEHIKIYGTIKHLWKPAPQEVWSEYWGGHFTHAFKFSQGSVHVPEFKHERAQIAPVDIPLNFLYTPAVVLCGAGVRP